MRENVKCINDSRYSSVTNGKVYTVFDISIDCCEKKCFTIKNDKGDILDNVYEQKDFEVIDVNPIYPKYKVGDMVEYIRATAPNPQLPITNILITYEIGNRLEMFREDELKPYIKPKSQEMTLKEVIKELGRDIKIVK
jgi:hypothetical protein